MIEFRVRKGEDEDDAINICNCCYRETGQYWDKTGQDRKECR